jgi:hypothetical protein
MMLQEHCDKSAASPTAVLADPTEPPVASKPLDLHGFEAPDKRLREDGQPLAASLIYRGRMRVRIEPRRHSPRPRLLLNDA